MAEIAQPVQTLATDWIVRGSIPVAEWSKAKFCGRCVLYSKDKRHKARTKKYAKSTETGRKNFRWG
jgi:hypothetical protein